MGHKSKPPRLCNATIVFTVGDDPTIRKVTVNEVSARWEAMFLFFGVWCPDNNIDPRQVHKIRIDGFMPSAYEVEHHEERAR